MVVVVVVGGGGTGETLEPAVGSTRAALGSTWELAPAVGRSGDDEAGELGSGQSEAADSGSGWWNVAGLEW